MSNNNIATKLSYGVYVVSTWTEGKPTGCIVNSIMQVTSKPATFAISVNHSNFTNECIKKSGKFAISVLAETAKPSVIGTFGFKSGRDTDKFEDVPYTVEGKLPVLTDSCGYIVCDVINTMETSTHTVFLGELRASGQYGDKQPMTYDYYHKVIKGKAPEAAPTYIEAAADANVKPAKKFRCTLCGYVYEGDELPADYVCPVCGVGPELFEEIS